MEDGRTKIWFMINKQYRISGSTSGYELIIEHSVSQRHSKYFHLTYRKIWPSEDGMFETPSFQYWIGSVGLLIDLYRYGDLVEVIEIRKFLDI